MFHRRRKGEPKRKKKDVSRTVPYTVYYPHSLPPTDRTWDQPYYQFLAIDPGIKNLGIRCERRYHIGMVETLFMESYSLSVDQECGDIVVRVVYEEISAVFRDLADLVFNSHFVLIEEQIRDNRNMIRVAQHIISCLSMMVRNSPLLPAILEVDSHLKTASLGAPRKMKKSERKRWTVEYALASARERNDQYTIAKILGAKKRDEFGDTACMIEAVYRLWRIVDGK